MKFNEVNPPILLLNPSPYSPEHAVPVQVRHDVRLHVVHDPPFLTLVQWEGLQRLPIVVKLSQDDCVVAGYKRARGVAIILQTQHR